MKLLNKPYPYLFSFKRNLIIALVVGMFIGIINGYFTDETGIAYLSIKHKILAGFITFVTMMFVFEVLMQFFIPEQRKENWTIKNEIIAITFLLLIIFIFNYLTFVVLYNDIPERFTLNTFLRSLFLTFGIGLIPTSVIIWINYTIILKRNLKATETYNKKLKNRIKNTKPAIEEDILTLPSKIKADSIKIDLNKLLFIRSDGNYIEVYFEEDEKPSVKLYRESLQEMETQLNKYAFIMKVHRSYLVNTRKILSTSGNARNYQLHFNNVEMTVPVARNSFKTFNDFFALNKE